MFISRIELDTSRGATRRAIGSMQILHAAVEGCFKAQSQAEPPGRKLWRIDILRQKLYLLIVSPTVPDAGSLKEQFCARDTVCEIKDYEPFLRRIENGQRFGFRFRGNPVQSVAGERGSRGKVSPHVTVAQKCAWLKTKSQSCGFSLEDDGFWLMETGNNNFCRRPGEKPVDISFAVFEGGLTVTDANLFVTSLTQGIGRAKAYGCGMLTVVRSR